MKLTKKQDRFCEEYVLDFNGTQAAIRSGYSKKTAKEIASENLTKPNIQQKISELLNKTEEIYKVNRTEVLKAVEEMAYEGEQEGNRRGALDMLMKHTGLYELDNVLSVTGDGLTQRIQVEFIEE